jgi:hypothetical protein
MASIDGQATEVANSDNINPTDRKLLDHEESTCKQMITPRRAQRDSTGPASRVFNASGISRGY